MRHFFIISFFSLLLCSSFTHAETLKFFMQHKNGEDNVKGTKGAYAVAPSINGKHVYVAGYLDDSIVLFSRGHFRFADVC